MATSLQDIQDTGLSNCCSAPVYSGLCAACKEHCEAVSEGISE